MMIRNNSNNNSNSKSSNGRESLAGGRNIPVGSQYHRRGHNVTGGGGVSKNNNGWDENLDLLSDNRCSLSVSSSDESSDGMLCMDFLPIMLPGIPSVVFCVSCNHLMRCWNEEEGNLVILLTNERFGNEL